MYSKKKTIDPSGNRRSTRHLPSNEATNPTLDMGIIGNHYIFDLSSRNIRRYIIEDIMFVSVGDLVTILVDINSCSSHKWQSISDKQKFELSIILIGGISYLQIPSRVRSNNRKDEFVSGHHDNDTINYLVLNKGGAGLTIDFVVKDCDKCMGGIEIKVSDFFLKDDIQMWGCKPML